MFWTIVSIVNYLLVGLAIIALLRSPSEPRAMLAWLLALLLLPVVGLGLFLLIGEARLSRTRRRRVRRRQKLAPMLTRRAEALREVRATHETVRIAPELTNLVNLATRLSRNPPTHGNEVTIYHDAEKTFQALERAIEAARSHIHLEYYIFQPDGTGKMMRDLLIKKAREGVACRILLDYIGGWNVPRSFLRPLKEAGAEVDFFMPVVPWRGRWKVNFRNHRKSAIIDGMVGFTGSQNIGDEYRGRLKKYGPWRDTHLRLEGPCVQDLQEIFVEDWHYATGKDLVSDEYFPPPRRAGERVVQVIPTGPDAEPRVMHQIFFAAVAAARRSVCVATPYFVPDTAMLLALQSAAYRGVTVQLLIPSRSDNWLVLWAGRSYYEELCNAGVEVFEFDGGMLHSKVVMVDESWALVGSANMDERSFRLSFEITTILYDAELTGTLQADFDALRTASRRVRPTGRKDWTFRQTLSLGLARLTSPLL